MSGMLNMIWGGQKKDQTPPPAAAPGTGAPQGASATPPRAARPRGASQPPMAPKPLELIKYDEATGQFSVGEEALQVLESVDSPIGVIAVCGRARQGKSYILNQLLERMTQGGPAGQGSGFKVAHSHRPCTKGLWMWSRPVEVVNPRTGHKHHVLLLDTEGIDAWDQTGQYSTQIFSLAILLSSLFVYNQLGGIDEKALDGLSLVTEMTRHIKARAGGAGTASELGEFSPSFLWLLRDFTLVLEEGGRTITASEYLETALRPVGGAGAAAESKNKIRESVKSLFPDRQCFTLVRPANDEAVLQHLDSADRSKLRPEFNEGMKRLMANIMDKAQPKRIGPYELRGPVLARLALAYVEAINKGAVPVIQTAWQGVAESTCRAALEEAIDVYRETFKSDTPGDEAALAAEHDRARTAALARFRDQAIGDRDILSAYEAKLAAEIGRAFEQTRRAALAESEALCRAAASKAAAGLDAKVRAAGGDLGAIMKAVEEEVQAYKAVAMGPKKDEILAEFYRNNVNGLLRNTVEAAAARHKDDSVRLERRAAESDKKAAGLEGELAQTQARLAAAEARIADLSRELQSAREGGKNERDREASRANGLQRELDAALASQRELAAAKTKAEGDLAAVRREKDRVEGELARAVHEAAESRKEAAAVREEGGRQRAAAAEAQEAARRAEAAAKGAREGAVGKEVELTKELQQARRDADSLRQSGADLRAQVAKLESERGALQREVTAQVDSLREDARRAREEMERQKARKELAVSARAEQAEQRAADAAAEAAALYAAVAAARAPAAGNATPIAAYQPDAKKSRRGEDEGMDVDEAPGSEGCPKTIQQIKGRLNELGFGDQVFEGDQNKYKLADWKRVWGELVG